MKETFKNKALSAFFIAVGSLLTVVTSDLTPLVFMAIIAVPLWLAKENYVE